MRMDQVMLSAIVLLGVGISVAIGVTDATVTVGVVADPYEEYIEHERSRERERAREEAVEEGEEAEEFLEWTNWVERLNELVRIDSSTTLTTDSGSTAAQ